MQRAKNVACSGFFEVRALIANLLFGPLASDSQARCAEKLAHRAAQRFMECSGTGQDEVRRM